MVKWAIELSEFDLHFELRYTIKSQALADFMAEWTPSVNPDPTLGPSAPELGDAPSHSQSTVHWVMNFDGSLTLQGAGAGVTLNSPTGDILKYLVRLDFRATNNMAEYEGLLADSGRWPKWGSAASWCWATLSWSSTKSLRSTNASTLKWRPTSRKCDV